MEEGGSMSDEQEAVVITDLEEVFLSREFGRAPAHRIAVGGTAESLDERSTSTDSRREVRARLRALPSPEASNGAAGAAVPRGNLQHRAIAAVSGVAAAALVVAGLVSGGSHPAHQDVSAQGKDASAGSPQGSVATAPSSSALIPVSSGPTAGTVGTTGAPATTVADVTRTGSPPPVTVEVPAGTTVTVVTSPPATGGTSTTTGGSTGGTGGTGGTGTGGSPAPTPPPTTTGTGDPLAPVIVTVGNTVTTVGSTVTSTVSQLASAVPALSPVTSLLAGTSTTVTSAVKSLNSATT